LLATPQVSDRHDRTPYAQRFSAKYVFCDPDFMIEAIAAA